MYAPHRFDRREPPREFGWPADRTTLDEFIDWLAGMPAERHYAYDNGSTCVCQQFYATKYPHHKVRVSSSHVDVYRMRGIYSFELPEDFNAIAHGYHSGPGAWTFGQALERAKRVRSQRRMKHYLSSNDARPQPRLVEAGAS